MFSQIKPVQHNEIKHAFTEKLHGMIREKILPNYYWVQICYKDQRPHEIICLVFEKNHSNKGLIIWPVEWTVDGIGTANIDFTQTPPRLLEKDLGGWVAKEWNYETWHSNALNCKITNPPPRTPSSFWDWRQMTVPVGNLACDADAIFRIMNKWVVLEATQIYYIHENTVNAEKDFYTHFYRLFTYRRKRSGRGFNWGQLYAQSNLSRLLGGKHILLLHQINDQNNVVDERIAYIELEFKKIEKLEKIENVIYKDPISQRQIGKKFASEMEISFCSLDEFFEKLKEGRL